MRLHAAIFGPLVIVATLACQPGPTASSEVTEAVARHPDRAAALLASLDLDRSGLERVRERAATGDHAGAIRALLEYYRVAETADWLRRGPYIHDPGGYDADIPEQATEILGDVFMFQGVRGKAARLEDGGIDWRYRGPRDDNEWSLFLNRHFLFVPLLKAYRASGESRYAAYLSDTVVDWVTGNPPEDLAEEALMSAAWQPMSAASRLLQSWPQAFFALQEETSFSAEARLLMLSSVPEQARHLRWHHRPHHNHTVKEMAGLAHAALAWPEFRDSEAWLEYAITVLSRELERQVYPDGVQKELSNHYHRNVLEYYLWVVEMCRAGGRPAPAWFEQRIEAMAAYLVRVMRPSGHGLLNNDGDLDFNRDFAAQLARLFDRADWRFIATSGREGDDPGEPSSFFPWAGHVVSRSDWSESAHWSWFDVGPYGLAHQHRDRLHLSVSPFGRDILVDTGRFIYEEEDPRRQWIQSSAAHNVVLVDGAGQLPPATVVEHPLPVQVVIGSAADLAVATFSDGFEGVGGQAVHTRAVSALKDEGMWIVVDRIETDRPRRIDALWHFEPSCDVAVVAGSLETTDPDRPNLRIIPAAGLQWSVEVVAGRDLPEVQGWFSRSYGEIEPAPTARYSGTIRGTSTFAWVMVAGNGRVPVTVVDSLPGTEGSVRLVIRRHGEPPMEVEVELDGRLTIRGEDREAIRLDAGVIREQDEIVSHDGGIQP